MLTIIRRQLNRFSRVEKVFYTSILLSGLIIAISTIFMQSKIQELQQELTVINDSITSKKIDYNNAKQEVSELTRYSRIKKIAEKGGLSVQTDNVKKVE